MINLETLLKTTGATIQEYGVLDNYVKLYIPSTANVDRPIENTEYVNKTSTLFSGLFGGATTYKVEGAWLSDDKGLVTEPVTIVEASTNDDGIKMGMPKILALAETIKKQMEQEAVMIEVNREVVFI